MPIDAFTISSNNYLGMTRVFADSYIEHHPGSRVFVCLVDRLDDRVPYEELPFEIILAEDLEIPEFPSFSFRYDILELNTAVKPFVFKYLRDIVGLDRVFYFDPDILVHDRLKGLEEALAGHQAVLTPHLTEPLDNSCRPPERVIGMCGVYNLGFVGLQLDDGTRGFVDWWCERLHRYCIVDLANGLFVDQSWMNFAPAYLDSVAIVRDPIFNIAYWNLPHRRPVPVGEHWEVDGRRVGFFHFSGVNLDNLDVISRHQDRVDLWSRPELRPLFEEYKDLVERSGQQELRRIPYHFETFAGTDIAVPWVARIALQGTDPRCLRWPDPFSVETDDSLLAWLSEPVEFRGHIVNRTALYLWQERADVKQEFSDIEGDDLGRYLEWFFTKGFLEEGFHEVFLEAFRNAPPTIDSYPFAAEIEEVARIDLSSPGDRTAWLNEPIDGVSKPLLTRLSMAIHRACPDVAAQYPDPLGAQRHQFAYWMVLEAGPSYALHRDLIEPIRRTLSARSRLSSKARRVAGRLRDLAGTRFVPKSLPVPTRAIEGPSVVIPDRRFPEELRRFLRSESPAGVNLVGEFDGDRGARSFAPWIRAALVASDVPHVTVSLDHELPEQEICDRVRYENGAPFPVTVLAVPPRKWNRVLAGLPLGSRLGTHVIGYCTEVGESDVVDSAPFVDEVWTPSQGYADRLRQVVQVPVRMVPPGVWSPSVAEEHTPRVLDRGRFWFLAVSGGSEEEDRRAVSAAIDCFRMWDGEESSSIGLCLAAGPGDGKLESQLRHLPVRVVSEPLTSEVHDRLISACDGFLDLHTNPQLMPIHLKVAMRGLPMVLGWRSDYLETVLPEDSGGRILADREPDENPIRFGIAALKKVIAEHGFDSESPSAVDCAAGSSPGSFRSGVPWKTEIERLIRGGQEPSNGRSGEGGEFPGGAVGAEPGR